MSDKNHARKNEIRAYAAEHAVNYTTAKRALDEQRTARSIRPDWKHSYRADDQLMFLITVHEPDPAFEALGLIILEGADEGLRLHRTWKDAAEMFDNIAAAGQHHVEIAVVRVPSAIRGADLTAFINFADYDDLIVRRRAAGPDVTAVEHNEEVDALISLAENDDNQAELLAEFESIFIGSYKTSGHPRASEWPEGLAPSPTIGNYGEAASPRVRR